ncbi:TrkH family potassium uptake protein [Castellaniella denitrificans]|uniref:Potassium transporter n=1 Tax=Castellaniella denitrificans TaxID=56119 RepID=A0ABT4M4G9_9BURK|nr:potassium transporter TrkG [Castellaniella denitrificans]MCZ4330213.1 potassium transporter [Castellaniella denitrificans]
MARIHIHPLRAYRQARHTGQLQASPPAVLAGSFLLLILAGTALLSLPIAQRQPFGIFEALFSATSAVTVTGLMIIDPATDLSFFGQAVLLALVQIGGIGFVTFAIIATLTLGRRVSLKYQALALEAFNQTSVSRIRQTAMTVLKFSLVIEGAAILILTLWWWRHDSLEHAFLLAGFHAVSAFNNAGMSLFPHSLAGFTGDPVTTFVITGCIILGGLGFSVLADIQQKRSWASLAYYTRLMLIGTLILNLASFALFWLIEARNPHTLGALPVASQGLAAWTQVIAARTAGFTSMDVGQLYDSSRFLLTGLMFIGGGSLSTTSGIKLATFIVLLAVVRAYILQRKEVVLMHRTIAPETIQKALALMMVSGLLVCLGIFLVSLFENQPFIAVVMEVMSAFTTTGISPDLTRTLSLPSQTVLILLMFIGRLGPLTLVYSLGTQRRSRVRYPETVVQIG